jgi:RNA polymerase sigma factor (TIGR02999 family)
MTLASPPLATLFAIFARAPVARADSFQWEDINPANPSQGKQPGTVEGHRGIIGVMTDVTQILSQIESGDPSAAEHLLPLVYQELRKLAAAKLAQEKPGQTLQATSLVHEAYIRLVDVEKAQHWDSRGHFFAAAAEAMRRILVDQARKNLRPKHGGELKRVDLKSMAEICVSTNEDLLALDEALAKLATEDNESAEIVKLKYFAGLTIPQIAELLGTTSRTVDRRWAYARSWLHQELAGR